MTATDLARRAAELSATEPQLRARDAARKLGVGEMELLALGLGRTATRLKGPWEEILKSLALLGPVMALTRNEHCVHEKTGVYENVSFNGHVGLALGEAIDLRIFIANWASGFAVDETSSKSARRSLQFFDAQGNAVHKVYTTNNTITAEYDALIARFRHPEQTPPATTAAIAPAAPRPDSAIDVAGFRAAWDGLKDTHDFFPMLRKFKVAREQALRLGGNGRARRASPQALRQVLQSAAGRDMPIMVFVGNPGIIQIHTGPVKKLLEAGPWYNVMDPGFNLHLRETAIANAWVVAKPTTDGQVTSLELFDDAGETIAMLFGKRKPGQPEDTAWRALAESLPAPAAAAAQ